MTDLNPELIAKAADAIDVRRHDFRVDTDTWRPHCICGWTAEEPHDTAAFDRHLAVATLEAVADDLRAEGAAQAREQEHRAPTVRHRDAITGQYVTADEADNRPDTTVRETRKP